MLLKSKIGKAKKNRDKTASILKYYCAEFLKNQHRIAVREEFVLFLYGFFVCFFH